MSWTSLFTLNYYSANMKILSLFDGISCAREALKRAGVDVESYYASEVDKYAIQISQKNWPDIQHIGNITEICSDEGLKIFIPEIDIMVGGSPCQDLSIAGKNRKGLDGARSGLFYEYVKIRDYVKPKFFILENVASMSKESKETITQYLGVEPIMINASLVSAQNRKRLFWIGKLLPNGKYQQVDICQPEDRNIFLKDILEHGEVDRDKSYCIDASYYKGANWDQYKNKGRRQLVIDENGNEKLKSNTIKTSGRGSGLGNKHNWDTIKTVRIGDIGSNAQAHRVYSPEGKSVALSALGGGQGAKTGLYKIEPVALRNRGNGKKPEFNGTGKANAMTSVQTDSMVAIIQRPQGKNKGGMHEEKTPTLTSNDWQNNHKLSFEGIIRKLTPIECERLQGVPYNYTEGISNTQRYKCLGNAFNVDVIAHILKQLK